LTRGVIDHADLTRKGTPIFQRKGRYFFAATYIKDISEKEEGDMRSLVSLAASLIILLVFVASVLADWSSNGNAVCTVPGWQSLPVLVADGDNGAYITWSDARSGHHDIYAQRINGSGSIYWTTNGRAVCTASGNQDEVEIIRDETGGVILTWQDGRGSDRDIYTQKVDSLGQPLWPADGVALCSASGSQEYPKIAPDGAGGAIIVWQDFRSTGSGIYAQKIDATGNISWTADGVPACSTSGEQYRPAIVTDGSGGAIIAWYDNRDGDNDIYAQRIGSGGSILWATDGVVVCDEAGDQQVANNFFWITSDGSGGAIVSWQDERSGNWDIYAQRVDADGNMEWTGNGVAICSAIGDQTFPEVAADELGGAFVAWQDLRSGDQDVYVQRISSGGNIAWTTNGVAVCTFYEEQQYPRIICDGEGGAIVTWKDRRSNPETANIYVQKLESNGSILWQPQGVEVCTAVNTQSLGTLASDEAGGAIIVWYDYRTEDYDIYANRINLGTEPSAAPTIIAADDVPNDQGGKIGIQWEKSALDESPNADISHYSVWRRLPKAETPAQYFSMALDTLCSSGNSMVPEGTPAVIFLSGFAWEWLDNVPAHFFETYALTVQSLYDSMGTDPGWQYFMVSAHTWDPAIFYDSAIDSGYSVDNLAPSIPEALTGEEVSNPAGLVLIWDGNVESDISGYAVYRGESGGFEPGPANCLLFTAKASAFDDEWRWDCVYRYKVSAIDVHGNESPCALLDPADIVKITQPDRITRNYLLQNFPNPFNPSTTITYSIGERTHVLLSIFNISGELIKTLVDVERESGDNEVTWDGRGEDGNPVASGVYFYRLEAKEFTQAKKMVLLK
jgi:hypothetical protein